MGFANILISVYLKCSLRISRNREKKMGFSHFCTEPANWILCVFHQKKQLRICYDCFSCAQIFAISMPNEVNRFNTINSEYHQPDSVEQSMYIVHHAMCIHMLYVHRS